MKFNKQFIEKIDAILPQTQCRQCGFSGCKPYATAIVDGQADINQCPPGNTDVINKIAALLDIEAKPLNTDHGLPKPRAIAVIDESTCIGCTFCIRACPVDAIVGAAKHMHTVITNECTGCELCVAPCPIDCIQMVPAVTDNTDSVLHENREIADRARARYQFKQKRLARKKSEAPKKNVITVAKPSRSQAVTNQTRKQAVVEAALKRAAAMRKRQTSVHDLDQL